MIKNNISFNLYKIIFLSRNYEIAKKIFNFNFINLKILFLIFYFIYVSKKKFFSKKI
jgi:hypothetical protein